MTTIFDRLLIAALVAWALTLSIRTTLWLMGV